MNCSIPYSVASAPPEFSASALAERFPERDLVALPSRRLAEHAAVDQALVALGHAGLRVVHAPTGKPRVAGSAGQHIAISHTWTADHAVLAAVAVHTGPVGIDIEAFRPQLMQVAPRVFTLAELHAVERRNTVTERDAIRCLIWAAKEAAWKAFGPDLAFKTGIEVLTFPDDPNRASLQAVRVGEVEYLFYLHIHFPEVGLALGPVPPTEPGC